MAKYGEMAIANMQSAGSNIARMAIMKISMKMAAQRSSRKNGGMRNGEKQHQRNHVRRGGMAAISSKAWHL